MRRFIVKKPQTSRSPIKKVRQTIVAPLEITKVEGIDKVEVVKEIEVVKEEQQAIKDNNVDEKQEVMDTKTKIELANAVLSDANESKVKKIKKDKGLIERTESSKSIITEDNRELLRG